MMLAGLDLASRLCGACVGDGAGLPHADTWEFAPCGEDYGALLVQLDDYLTVTHTRFGIEAVAYEAPILIARGRNGERYGDNLRKLRLLYPLGAHVEFWCKRRAIPCFEVSIAAVKKEVTGNAYAAKDDMVAIARKIGMQLPPGEKAKDAADALGAWLLLLREMNPAKSQDFDRLIWTPKGALL